MSIERGPYSPPEPIELELEYTGFPEPVYSLPLQTGWEDVEPVTLEPYVPPALEAQTPQPQKEIITQTNVTEVTQIVETAYQEADFDPLPPMEFRATAPGTYGAIGYFAVLLLMLLFRFVPADGQEM